MGIGINDVVLMFCFIDDCHILMEICAHKKSLADRGNNYISFVKLQSEGLVLCYPPPLHSTFTKQHVMSLLLQTKKF